MNLKKHHIKKQLLDFHFSNKSSASKWQQNFSFKYQDELLRSMNSIFDHYDDENYYEIQKIELDLGVISEAELTSKFKTELYRELGKVLKKTPPSKNKSRIDSIEKKASPEFRKGGKTVLIEAFVYFLVYGSFPWNAAVSSLGEFEEQLKELFSFSEISRQLKQRNSLKSRWEKQRLYYQFSPHFAENLFVLYFKSEFNNLLKIANGFAVFFSKLSKEGFLPGEENIPYRIESAEALQWIALESPGNPAHWPVGFLNWSLGKQRVWRKIMENFPGLGLTLIDLNFEDSSVDEIATHLHKIFLKSGSFSSGDISEKDPGKESWQENRGGEKEKIIKPDKEQDSEKWQDNTSKSEPKEGKPDTGEVEKSAVKSSDQNKGLITREDKEKKSPESSEENTKPESTKGDSTKAGSTKEGDFSEEINKESDSHTKSEKTEISSKESRETSHAGDWQEKFTDFPVPGFEKIENEDSHFSSLSELYVTHSGQVLIWPYLSRLFEKLQYTRNQKFNTIAQQERAVLLLGYLATGSPQCEEHQLVVSKLLCGWSLHKSLRKNIELQEFEKKEAELMLTNLIQNWRMLKNTSIAGLRETFFSREGKLVENGDDWKLLVEQKGVDILLDYLPYTISVVKLPWVNKTIMIDWA